MTTIEATTEIAAPATRVWEQLLDLSAWPARDPLLERAEGSLTPGGRLTVHLRDGARPFRLRVLTAEPGRRLVLRGGMPLGLFHGTRHYTLDPLTGDRTGFAVREVYAGPLAPLVTRSIPDLQPSFEAFAAGLRRDAEAATDRSRP